jgi:DNA-binding response OmpR family regulator
VCWICRRLIAALGCIMMEAGMAYILVVEDDAYIAKLLSVRLTHSGHSIIEARDGNQALARARSHAPDLILLDVTLPAMNGFAVLQHLKQNPTTHEIPVLMLTAQTDGRSVLTGIDRGADAYLTKPIDFPDLIQRIERCLSRRAALMPMA